MYVQKKIIIIVCEGTSERAYIQELNRLLKEENIPLSFIPRSSDGGQYSKVESEYKKARKDNRNTRILIWIDWDRYQRNDNLDMDNYKKKPTGIPEFLFSYQNFEDFLFMHKETEDLEKWIMFCSGKNHFHSPLHSAEYIETFKSLFNNNYSKGEIPIDINSDSLNNLQKHQNDQSIKFKCDFARELFNLINLENRKDGLVLVE